MIFLSLLAKTFALALLPQHPTAAACCWLAGALCDLPWRRADAEQAGAGSLPGRLLLLHGISLAVGLAVAAGCDYGAMRWKDGIPAFAAPVAWLLGLCGAASGAGDGAVYLTTMAGPQEFAVSIDHLALKVPVLFLALALVRLLWAAVPIVEVLRRLGTTLAVLLGCALLRMAAVILLANLIFDFNGYDAEELPYRPFMGETFRLLLHLPFLLAAGIWLDRLIAAPAAAPAATPPLPAWLRWAGPPAALLLAFAMFWQPEGELKTEKKVVMVSGHARWSQAARPYDREWYGADSGYNYACMKRLFGWFAPVHLADGPALTAADIKDASTLVIYDPDRAFSADELALIHDFVREGGGLLVIGDHTNVFGSSTHLNAVCEPFGFQYRDDVLFDLDQDFHQVIDAPALAPRAWHGIDFFRMRGPASIRPTAISTRAVYQVEHSKSVRADYSVNNFFPPPRDHPRMKSGTFCISATANYGRGRVAAWGDSTVFSNFEIFYPGKCEFLLNTLHWLNHRDSALTLMGRRMALACGGLAVLGILLAFRRPSVWLGVTATTALALLGGWALGRVVEHRHGGFPAPAEPSEWVVFTASSTDKTHGLRHPLAEGPYDQRYEVFTQWVMRTGPMTGFHLLDAPRANELSQHLRGSGKARVARAFIIRKPEDMADLEPFAAIPSGQNDPTLLMFASSVKAEDAVAAMTRFGLLDQTAAAGIAAAWPNGEALVTAGGRRVLVVAGAERFSDQMMGISEKVVPDAAQRALFNQAYGVIDRLFGREPAPAP